MLDIGKEIRDIRKSLGLTQTRFAKLFNRSKPRVLKTTGKDISSYEKNNNQIPLKKWLKFQSLKKGN